MNRRVSLIAVLFVSLLQNSLLGAAAEVFERAVGGDYSQVKLVVKKGYPAGYGQKVDLHVLLVNQVPAFVLQRSTDDGTGLKSIEFDDGDNAPDGTIISDITSSITDEQKEQIKKYGGVLAGPLVFIEETKDSQIQYLVVGGQRTHKRTKYVALGVSTGSWNAWESLSEHSVPELSPSKTKKIVSLFDETNKGALPESLPLNSLKDFKVPVTGATSYTEQQVKWVAAFDALSEKPKVPAPVAAPETVGSRSRADSEGSVASTASAASTAAGGDSKVIEDARALEAWFGAYEVSQSEGIAAQKEALATIQAQFNEKNSQLAAAVEALSEAVTSKLEAFAALTAAQGKQGAEVEQLKEKHAAAEKEVADLRAELERAQAAAQAAQEAAKAEHDAALAQAESDRTKLQDQLEGQSGEVAALQSQMASVQAVIAGITGKKSALEKQEKQQQANTKTITEELGRIDGERDAAQIRLTELRNMLRAESAESAEPAAVAVAGEDEEAVVVGEDEEDGDSDRE